MNEDEKMFQIGIWALGAVLLLTIGLQVCYRTQNRSRDRVRRQIIQTQQKFAAAQDKFESFTSSDVLRNMVVTVSPRAEVIGFHKYVTIAELSDRAQ